MPGSQDLSSILKRLLQATLLWQEFTLREVIRPRSFAPSYLRRTDGNGGPFPEALICNSSMHVPVVYLSNIRVLITLFEQCTDLMDVFVESLQGGRNGAG